MKEYALEESLPLLQTVHVASIPKSHIISDRQKRKVVVFSTDTQNEKWTRAIGYLCILGASLNFSFTSFVLRTAQTVFQMPSATVMFMIFSCDMVLAILYVIFTANPSMLTGLKKRDLMLIVARGMFGILSTIAVFAGMKNAPVGDVTAAYSICPAITLVFAAIILRESIYRADVFALILSLVGVILITRPAGVDSELSQHSRAAVTGTMYGLLSGVLGAAAILPIRMMGRNVHFIIPALSLFTFATVYSSLTGGIPSFSEITSYGYGTVLTLSASVSNFLAQVLMNLGLHRCPAGPALLIRNIETPLNYFLGILFLHEVPTSLRISAACLIIISTSIIGVRNALRS